MRCQSWERKLIPWGFLEIATMLKPNDRLDLTGRLSKRPGKYGKFDIIVEIDGWITDEKATEIRNKMFPELHRVRATISNWRLNGWIRSMSVGGKLWLVSEDDVRNMPEPPEGARAFHNKEGSEWSRWCAYVGASERSKQVSRM